MVGPSPSCHQDPEALALHPWALVTLSLADNRLHSLEASLLEQVTGYAGSGPPSLQLGKLQTLDLSSNPLHILDTGTAAALSTVNDSVLDSL